MLSLARSALCVCLALPAFAAPPVNEILARLAANQERAVEARKSIVYRQNVWSRIIRTNGKVSREEKREYAVAPTPQGTQKKLEKFEGRYEKGGKFYPYDKPGHTYKDLDIDGELIGDLTDDLVNDKKSRDGISHDLFPLTASEQQHYNFEFAGTRKVGGVEALRLTFKPGKHENDFDERPWAGEVLVHPEEFQPLSVTTKLALKIPVAVKIFLGIDIKQLGFNITYKKVDQDLWFPATYGTEFGLKLLFGYRRNITLNMTNSDFRRTSVDSTIQYKTP